MVLDPKHSDQVHGCIKNNVAMYAYLEVTSASGSWYIYYGEMMGKCLSRSHNNAKVNNFDVVVFMRKALNSCFPCLTAQFVAQIQSTDNFEAGLNTKFL